MSRRHSNNFRSGGTTGRTRLFLWNSHERNGGGLRVGGYWYQSGTVAMKGVNSRALWKLETTSSSDLASGHFPAIDPQSVTTRLPHGAIIDVSCARCSPACFAVLSQGWSVKFVSHMGTPPDPPLMISHPITLESVSVFLRFLRFGYSFRIDITAFDRTLF
jgi:hypothetical protein